MDDLENATVLPAEYRGRKVVATYTAVDRYWTDIPEASPRCRVKVAKGQPACPVEVDESGQMRWLDGRDLEIDTYDDPPPDREDEAPGTQAERYASIRENRSPTM